VIRFDAAERVVRLYSCFPKDWHRADQTGHLPAKPLLQKGGRWRGSTTSRWTAFTTGSGPSIGPAGRPPRCSGSRKSIRKQKRFRHGLQNRR